MTMPPLLISACMLAAMLLFATPPVKAAESSPAGHYVLTGMREVGSELLLTPDGRFEYMLAYGAYDESASGTWQLQGRQVLLNSTGTHTPPKFALQRSTHDPEPVVSVQVVDANGNGLSMIDVIVDVDGSGGQEGYTQTYGYRIQAEKAAAPKMIALGVKMYQVDWQAFTDLPATHNNFVFTFEPGSLGKAQFRDLAFEWDGTALTTVREGQPMRYVRR